jgi:hypothetical protein
LRMKIGRRRPEPEMPKCEVIFARVLSTSLFYPSSRLAKLHLQSLDNKVAKP